MHVSLLSNRAVKKTRYLRHSPLKIQPLTCNLVTILTFPIFLAKLRNEKRVWFRQKNRKQMLSIILYGNRRDNNKILSNQIA